MHRAIFWRNPNSVKIVSNSKISRCPRKRWLADLSPSSSLRLQPVERNWAALSWECRALTGEGRVGLSETVCGEGRKHDTSRARGVESEMDWSCNSFVLNEQEEEGATAPIVDALKECADMDAAAFHFPGHSRGAAAPPLLANLVGTAPFAHDLPELPELDNLYAPEGVIADAQRKAATLFGADVTWFLVNGSTCGIQAAVMATCSPGDYLVLPRNSHMSAVSAMTLSGALPKYMMPSLDSRWGIAHGVIAQQVEVALSEVEGGGGRVGAVLIVSPTYFGVCSMVESIAHVCHKHGVPLLVDEAHGAHFRFQASLPKPALEQGADIAVQSTHKVLGSLTQSAMLHAQGTRVSYARVAQCLQILQTSSPSYLLLASLDAARAQMGEAEPTNPTLDATVSLALMARNALQKIPGLLVLDTSTVDERVAAEGAIAGIDPLRITVGLWRLGMTGFEADDILRLEFGVVAELPSLLSLTFAISAGTSPRDIQRLIDSLSALSARLVQTGPLAPKHNVIKRDQDCAAYAINESGTLLPGLWGQVVALSPREAFFAENERVELADAVGRVSAELLCPYPPGIPVIAPGEVLTQAAIDYVRTVLEGGGIVTGASDASFTSVCVVCERYERKRIAGA